MSDIASAAGPARTPPPLPSTPPPAGEPAIISWSGNPWSLAGLGFINVLLTIITLGVYHFWAKTEVRRRLVTSIRVNSEPIEYTGTGMELFLGFLIIFAVILLPVLVIVVGAHLLLGEAGTIVLLPVYGFFIYLWGVAVYRARRYRRSRLRWRGIRGAMTGSSWGYGWGSLWSSLLIGMTWGWITPWRDNYLHRRLLNDTRFGDRPFLYSGQPGPMYGAYALAWVGQLVAFFVILGIGAAVLYPFATPLIDAVTKATGSEGSIDWKSPEFEGQWPLIAGLIAAGYGFLGLYAIAWSLIWNLFYAREYSYFVSETKLEGLRFGLKVSAWSMFWLFFSNTLMSILTLTILSPVAEARVARYFVQRLSSTGSIDFAGILQSQQKISRTGEGLAEAFDVEASSYFILSI